MSAEGRRRSLGPWLAVVVALAVMTGALLAAPRWLSGARGGALVTWALPATRGRIAVGAATWSWSAVAELVRGRPAAIALDDVRVVDPEGTEVLAAGGITALVEVHRAP